MELSSIITLVGWLMTFIPIVSCVGCQVSNHHINNKDLIFKSHVKVGS
jgi:hypothetical protein